MPHLFSARKLQSLLLAGISLSVTMPAAGTPITAYSYRQVNIDQTTFEEIVYENSVGPSAVPSRTATETPVGSDGTYQFDVAASSGPTTLSARASLNASVDQSAGTSNELWESVLATAQAKSSFAEIGTVHGAGGIPGGFVSVQWTVDGTTTLSVKSTGLIEVQNISNTAQFVSNIPGHGGLIFDDFLDSPFQGGMVESADFDAMFPVASGALAFEVPWIAGQDVALLFDLCLDVIAQFTNIDASQAESGLDLNLSNTATLMGIEVLDGNRDIIAGATFEFQAAVPEADQTLLIIFASLTCVLVFKTARDIRRRPIKSSMPPASFGT